MDPHTSALTRTRTVSLTLTPSLSGRLRLSPLSTANDECDVHHEQQDRQTSLFLTQSLCGTHSANKCSQYHIRQHPVARSNSSIQKRKAPLRSGGDAKGRSHSGEELLQYGTHFLLQVKQDGLAQQGVVHRCMDPELSTHKQSNKTEITK